LRLTNQPAALGAPGLAFATNPPPRELADDGALGFRSVSAWFMCQWRTRADAARATFPPNAARAAQPSNLWLILCC
jgi:hypothetical protein